MKINKELIEDLKKIRESLSKINDMLEDITQPLSLKNTNLGIIQTQNKTLALWISAIGSQAKLIQTNINIKESKRLAKRFK
jgi:hypothetical protein